MTKGLSLLGAGMIALLLAASPALALSSRTFVSGAGSDAGACPITTPCRTFAFALTQTAPSGEIIVLSSAGYGPVTITQAVSIINTSSFAGVTVPSGGNGITINAGVSDSVVLRGLTIDGGGTGSNGMVFNSGGALTVDQCNLMNFVGGNPANGNGVSIQPTSGSHKIVVTNTTASNNTTGINHWAPSISSTTEIVIDRVSANNNSGYGIEILTLNGTVTASISNSAASFNSTGFYFSEVNASLDGSYVSNNGNGIYIDSGTLELGRSIIMNNAQNGINIVGGFVNSYKDNRIALNGTQVSGTIGTATLY